MRQDRPQKCHARVVTRNCPGEWTACGTCPSSRRKLSGLDCQTPSAGSNSAFDRRLKTNCPKLRAPNCLIIPADLSASNTARTVDARASCSELELRPSATKSHRVPTLTGPPSFSAWPSKSDVRIRSSLRIPEQSHRYSGNKPRDSWPILSVEGRSGSRTPPAPAAGRVESRRYLVEHPRSALRTRDAGSSFQHWTVIYARRCRESVCVR